MAREADRIGQLSENPCGGMGVAEGVVDGTALGEGLAPSPKTFSPIGSAASNCSIGWPLSALPM